MVQVKKRDATLNPKEMLDLVLVPEWEWPYKLPENWCWVRLGALISSSKENTSNFSTDIKYVGLEHIEKDSGKIEYGSAENVKSLKNRFYAGQILYGKLRPYLNKHGIPTFDGVCSTDILVFDAQKITIAEYINYFLDTRDFLEYTISNSRGVNLPRVSEKTILGAKCPLAPLPEQKRIVNRIESLFAKLDEAKEKAQATLDSYETRKAAILHKAFAGELTANWRTERNISLDSWCTAPLSHISTLQTGLMKGKKYDKQTVNMPYLRVANVQDGFLDLAEIKEIEVSVDQIDRYKLRVGDVLFTEGGDFDKLGRGTVWEGQIAHCLHQNHIFVVRPDSEILDPYFLSYQAGSKYGKDYFTSCAKQTTNLASINSTQLKSFPVLIPSMEEQVRIVQIVRELMEKEQQAKTAAEVVVEKIEQTKKAILSFAFRGELGTNDPTEERAVGLLGKINL